jgi:hypothetical protein
VKWKKKRFGKIQTQAREKKWIEEMEQTIPESNETKRRGNRGKGKGGKNAGRDQKG